MGTAVWITGFLGALLGGLITAVVNQAMQAHTRTKELAAARDDKHRDELRNAYVDFIAAFSRFLDTGALLYATDKAIDELPGERAGDVLRETGDQDAAQEALENAVTPALRERGRKALEDFAAATMTANTLGTAALIIDDEPTRRKRVRDLDETMPRPPQGGSTDRERFHTDLENFADELASLVTILEGAFTPDRWQAEVIARRTLEAQLRKLLRKGPSRSD